MLEQRSQFLVSLCHHLLSALACASSPPAFTDKSVLTLASLLLYHMGYNAAFGRTLIESAPGPCPWGSCSQQHNKRRVGRVAIIVGARSREPLLLLARRGYAVRTYMCRQNPPVDG